MGMRNVERSSELLARLLGRQTRPDRASRQPSATQPSSQAPAGRGPATADQVTLSEQAQRLQRLQADLAAARSAFEAVPDSRPERVAEARDRLGSGAYRDDGVRDEVAGRVGAVIRKLEDLID